jgi:hypothetical protein
MTATYMYLCHISVKKWDVHRFLAFALGEPRTKLPSYDFLKSYGAYLHAPRTPKQRHVVNNLPRYGLLVYMLVGHGNRLEYDDAIDSRA